MATVALAAAASAAEAGAIATAVLIAMGNYIDARYTYPTLFPADPLESGKADDMQLAAAREGAPVYFVTGTRCRVPGVLVWTGPLQETAAASSVGKGQTVINYKYYASVLFLQSRNKVSVVKKVWFDGDVVYDAEPETLSTTHTASPSLELRVPIVASHTLITTLKSEFDLTQFVVGSDFTTTNFSNAGNNGTFEVLRAYESGTRTFIKYVNPSAVEELNPPSNATVSQTPTLWEPGLSTGGKTFRYGAAAATPSTVLQNIEGTDTYANRDRMSLIIANLALQKWGLRVPSIESLLETTSTTLEDVLGDIFGDAGLDAADYDASTLTDTVYGYAYASPVVLATVLQPLLVAHDLMVLDNDGVLQLVKRDNVSEVTVDRDDLDARDFGALGLGRFRVEQADRDALPGTVNVTFVNKENEYKQGSVNATTAARDGQNTLNVNLPLSLDASDARAIATRLLWRMRVDIDRYTVVLPPKYSHVRQGDMLVTTDENAVPIRLLVSQMSRDPETMRMLCTCTHINSNDIDYTDNVVVSET